MNFDAEFWVAVCFFIFIFLVQKPIRRFFINFLDQRSSKIRKELEEVDMISHQANETLNEHKKRKITADKEIREIIASAENEIKKLKENAEREINEYLDKRVAQIMDKIMSRETQIIQQLKSDAVDKTVRIVEQILRENIKDQVGQDIVNTSISNLSKKIH